jgi:hypothetical protein
MAAKTTRPFSSYQRIGKLGDEAPRVDKLTL